ncbi:hypothetical protein DYE48_12235 [Halobacillus trueperi]|uniref:Uncharacterized protein n=1 Tax=Halobacillus trueperi TaxID=156205 RepID=A0A3E0J7G2_9BACI|nr:hypothetical protein DYE48_12235 [Halobacillus trueperi]
MRIPITNSLHRYTTQNRVFLPKAPINLHKFGVYIENIDIIYEIFNILLVFFQKNSSTEYIFGGAISILFLHYFNSITL